MSGISNCCNYYKYNDDNRPSHYKLKTYRGFIFKHSNNIICNTKYGFDIPAIVNKDNIFGFQFHPEKSGRSG